ncbi:MAG: UDP-N-acetylmuramate dehydrogenase [Pseudomonadales bacterium]|nr:UDP-N-acetylmuramate dehydrogenase [Pseudomonadales bacterium]
MSYPIPNTLNLPANAQAGGLATSIEDVRRLREMADDLGLPFRAIGAGSNIVPEYEVAEFVAVMKNRGVKTNVKQGVPHVDVAAGENWHDLVTYCASKGLHGLENLALIPGTVGAAPIQNIGAYGVEISDFIESVTVCDEHGLKQILSQSDCGFSYRESTFKTQPELVVVSVQLALSREFNPRLDYPDVLAEFDRSVGDANALVTAITSIRQRKLPDPAIVPNVGSFFKNPVVTVSIASRLREKFKNLVAYEVQGGIKLSAAQLIDHAGWKDRPTDKVGCWQQQPLVLVNLGGATTEDVIAYATAIQQEVLALYGVQLELEPSLLS